MAVWLTKRGLALASIAYRVSSEALFPAQIQDCKAAVRWLRANADAYSLDAEHIGVWGDSAGGHLVILLGTTAGVSVPQRSTLPASNSTTDKASPMPAPAPIVRPSVLPNSATAPPK